MKAMKQRQGALDLVALQMTDQVPAHARYRGGLAPQLLRPALTEIIHSQLRQQRGNRDGDRFGDGDKRDLVPFSARAPAGGTESFFHGGQIVGDPLSTFGHDWFSVFGFRFFVFSIQFMETGN